VHLVQGPSLASPTDGMADPRMKDGSFLYPWDRHAIRGSLSIAPSYESTISVSPNPAHFQWMILTLADLQAKVVVSCTGVATCWPSVYTQPLLA